MPLSENSEQIKKLREEFAAAQEGLEDTNAREGEVIAAMDMPAAQRGEELKKLAMGYPRRRELLEKFAAAHDLVIEAQADYDKVADAAGKENLVLIKVQARRQEKKLLEDVRKTNISAAAIQNNILDLYQGQIEKARKAGDEKLAQKKLAERDAALKKVADDNKDFPARVAALNELKTRFDTFVKIKGSVDDAEDLKRLLRGSGVLEFHIGYVGGQGSSEDQIEAQALIKRLHEEGPLPRPGDRLRWYEVDDPEQVHLQMQTWGEKYWALCYVTPNESMIHREGEAPWGLTRAHRDTDQRSGETVVAFSFDPRGALLFGDLSGSHIGRPLAIVLDNKLIGAPNLQSRIEGNGIITGQRSEADLNYLIRTLNAGSLPAPWRKSRSWRGSSARSSAPTT